MWKSWKSKISACLLLGTCLLLAACGGYRFDEAAQSGSYSQAPNGAGSLPQPSNFALQANAEVTMSLAGGRANVLLGNPEENTRDCRVALILDDTGETVYETEVLHPGERIAYAGLDTDAFEGAGEYAATAVFTILDEETGETIGRVEAGLVIRAE